MQRKRPDQRYDGGRAPEAMTEACYYYFCDWMDNTGFFAWASQAAKSDAEAQRAQLRSLSPGERGQMMTDLLEADFRDEPYAPGYRAYHRALLEMVHVRHADSYVAYVNGLLVLIFSTRPETLRSAQERESLEFILQYSSMDELVAAIVEKHVEGLSYMGIDKLAVTLEERHGLRLFSSKEQRREVSRVIETRNAIVHNRGLISRIFKARVPDAPGAVGSPVALSDDQIAVDSEELARAVKELDVLAVGKFGLEALHEYTSLEAYARRRGQGIHDMTGPDGRRV